MQPQQLIDAISEREREERVARGLPPSHLTDFAHFPFFFATAAVQDFDRLTTKALSAQPQAALFAAMAALALKDVPRANDLITKYQSAVPSDPRGRMRFGVEPAPPSSDLPKIDGTFPTEPCLFVCCDETYLRNYASSLLLSVADHSPGTRVHVHLIDTNPVWFERASKFPLNFSLSFEDSRGFVEKHGMKRHDYYGAVRFIRFAEALESCPRLWGVDADALAAGDIGPLFRHTAPIAMRVRAGRLEPWNQFSACLVMGSADSRAYFRTVANILRADLHAPWWGIDQYALYSAWLKDKPPIELLGPDVTSVDDNIPGLFWFTAGRKKKEILSAPSPYAVLFREYLRRVG